jgi:hypothetical protein
MLSWAEMLPTRPHMHAHTLSKTHIEVMPIHVPCNKQQAQSKTTTVCCGFNGLENIHPYIRVPTVAYVPMSNASHNLPIGVKACRNGTKN